MPSTPAQRLTAVAAAIATLFAAWLMLMHLRMIISPAPQEMREGAVVWITQLLLDGRNPYALSELPASTNVYGILYHFAVYPFARIAGNSFAVHRFVSALSIAGACLLLYRLLRARRVDRMFAWVGTLLFYFSCVYFVAPLARPDSLGLLLAMASLTLLVRASPTVVTDIAAVDMALLAGATKIYFAFPPFVLAIYFVLFGPRRRGVIIGTVAGAGLLALLYVLSLVFPAYINLSLVTNLQGGYRDINHLRRQTIDWMIYSLPLVIGLIAALPAIVQSVVRRSRPDPLAFVAAVNAVVFFGWLGHHNGAHMTYLFQLITPVLIPAVWPILTKTSWPRAIVTASLPVALVLNAGYFPWTFARFTASETQFARLEETIRSRPRVLGSTEVAGLVALAGKPVVDSGQSEYFEVAGRGDSWPGVIPGDVIWSQWDRFVTEMTEGIEAGRYEIIIRSRRRGLIPEDPISPNYALEQTIDLDFAWSGQQWPVDVWLPRAR